MGGTVKEKRVGVVAGIRESWTDQGCFIFYFGRIEEV